MFGLNNNINFLFEVYVLFPREYNFELSIKIKCRRLKWAGHVVRMREVRIVFKISTGKPTGNINGGTQVRIISKQHHEAIIWTHKGREFGVNEAIQRHQLFTYNMLHIDKIFDK